MRGVEDIYPPYPNPLLYKNIIVSTFKEASKYIFSVEFFVRLLYNWKGWAQLRKLRFTCDHLF